jgi:hypothetical protein
MGIPRASTLLKSSIATSLTRASGNLRASGVSVQVNRFLVRGLASESTPIGDVSLVEI